MELISELILNFNLVSLISFVLGPDFINLIEVSVYDMLMEFFVGLSKIAVFASQKMGCTEEPEETYANQLDQLLLEMFLNKWQYTACIFTQIKLQFGLGLCQAVIIAFFLFLQVFMPTHRLPLL